MKHRIALKPGIVAAIIFVAAISRLLPHPYNFTPVTAIALFGGAMFSRKWLAFILPLAAIWISDILLNNLVYSAYFEGFSWFGSLEVYIGFMLVTGLGWMLLSNKRTVLTIAGSSLTASLLFFLVTNFGSWLTIPAYPKDFSGLMAAYLAGIPFLRPAILGDLLYTGVLFGVFELLRSRWPALQVSRLKE